MITKIEDKMNFVSKGSADEIYDVIDKAIAGYINNDTYKNGKMITIEIKITESGE